jgi:ATP-dependent Lhr-like helicase
LRDSSGNGIVVLAAADPANPYGASLPWPQHDNGSPTRRAGAYVILADGILAGFVERGARSMLTWLDDEAVIVNGLIEVGKRRSKPTTIATINGVSSLSSSIGAALLSAGFVTGYKGVTFRPGR